MFCSLYVGQHFIKHLSIQLNTKTLQSVASKITIELNLELFDSLYKNWTLSFSKVGLLQTGFRVHICRCWNALLTTRWSVAAFTCVGLCCWKIKHCIALLQLTNHGPPQNKSGCFWKSCDLRFTSGFQPCRPGFVVLCAGHQDCTQLSRHWIIFLPGKPDECRGHVTITRTENHCHWLTVLNLIFYNLKQVPTLFPCSLLVSCFIQRLWTFFLLGWFELNLVIFETVCDWFSSIHSAAEAVGCKSITVEQRTPSVSLGMAYISLVQMFWNKFGY